jgi:hypothetical protein
MNARAKIGLSVLGALFLCLALPVLGALVKGASVAQYLEFPPVTRYVVHAPFSWAIFWAGLVLETALLYVPLLIVLSRASASAETRNWIPRRFPWWGWAGLALGACAWILAWSRFPWFARWQRHTFTPLWVAYILGVNAWRYRRTGRSMLTDSPLYFLLLFPISAVFWWLFEYLNRFVQNWYYVNVADTTARQYFWMATLPFSTVLPAVLGTYELLGSYVGETPLVLSGHAGRRAPLKVVVLTLAPAMAGLFGIGFLPDYFFPLLWVAPLLVLASFMEWGGEDSILFRSPWPRGARRVALLAVSALICGFFWEMWNYRSLAKWMYAVPFVNRFRIFEMPLLGYAGYLPFGLECGLVGIALARLLGADKVEPSAA